MLRPFLIAALAATLSVPGCTAHKSLIPPGQDPDELAAAVFRRGQGEGPPAPGSLRESTRDTAPGSPLLGKCLEIVGIAAVACVFVPFCLLYLAAQSRPPAL